jgi:hypothetical protein
LASGRAIGSLAAPLVGALLVFAAAAPARADPGPLIRAGEWQTQIISMDGSPAPAIRLRNLCVPTDRRLTVRAVHALVTLFPATCPRQDVRTTGPVTQFDLACRIGEMRISAQGTVTWNGLDALDATAHANFAAGELRVPDIAVTAASRRLGPCQPGDTPAPPW